MLRGQTQYTKALEAQLDLLRFYDSEQARNVFSRRLNQLRKPNFARYWANNASSTPSETERANAYVGSVVLSAVREQLAFGSPYYIAPHICHMLEDSMADFPGDIIIQPTDFPTKTGFVFLDSIWEVGETPGGSIDYLTGFSWSISNWAAHIMFYGPNRTPGYPTVADNLNQLNQFDVWDFGTPYDVDRALESVANQDDTVEWEYINQFGQLGRKRMPQKEAATLRYLELVATRKMAYAVLHFINQKIVSLSPRRIPREVRRRMPPTYEGDPVVQVITLRGYEESLHPYEVAEANGREWASRWVVRGHWRKQYYPSLGPKDDPASHKPVWIDAYVKGPDGLPVKNATKLFAVTR